MPAQARADDDFTSRVVEIIEAIPEGEVMTYGEVAAEAGFPGAARAVGNVLGGSGGTLPWWRVVTSTGRLVPDHEPEQAQRLRSEGVSLLTEPTRVAMSRR
jgi:methylated-DNA-protein-cysteine methyltransferase-like protein